MDILPPTTEVYWKRGDILPPRFMLLDLCLSTWKKHSGWQWGSFSPVSTARTDLWVHVRKRGQSLLCCCVFVCVCVYICYWSWESLVVWRSVSFSAADSRSGSGQSAPQIGQTNASLTSVRVIKKRALCRRFLQDGVAAARPAGGSRLALRTFTSLCKHVDVCTASWQSHAKATSLPLILCFKMNDVLHVSNRNCFVFTEI